MNCPHWDHVFLVHRKRFRVFLRGSYSVLELNIGKGIAFFYDKPGKCTGGYEFILHLWCTDCYLKWSWNYYDIPRGIAKKIKGGRW